MLYFNQLFGFPANQFFKNLVIAMIAIAIGLVIKLVLKRMFLLLCRYWATFIIGSVIKRLSKPVGFFIPLFLLNVSLAFMVLHPATKMQLSRILEIALTINFCVLLIRFIKVMEDYFFHKVDLKKEDNLKERKLRTQFQFIRKFAISIIVIVTAAIILLSFESMRKIGTGLLTGVGIGGLLLVLPHKNHSETYLPAFRLPLRNPSG